MPTYIKKKQKRIMGIVNNDFETTLPPVAKGIEGIC